MSDVEKWAKSTNEEVYEIARNWAKKYTTKKLRGLQTSYTEYIKMEENGCNDSFTMKGLDNMWQCATWAIDIREFGE